MKRAFGVVNSGSSKSASSFLIVSRSLSASSFASVKSAPLSSLFPDALLPLPIDFRLDALRNPRGSDFDPSIPSVGTPLRIEVAGDSRSSGELVAAAGKRRNDGRCFIFTVFELSIVWMVPDLEDDWEPEPGVDGFGLFLGAPISPFISMVDWRDIPLIRGLFLPKCRDITYRSIPFAMIYSSPFILLYCYYGTHDMKPMKKWEVKLMARDFLIGWGVSIIYVTLRTMLLDPYCDPYSLHYDKNLNAFDRKKRAVEAMGGILDQEGRGKS